MTIKIKKALENNEHQPSIDRMLDQRDEFMALGELTKAYHNMPAVVDDDYPRARHEYEVKLAKFIDALRKNGRL